MRSRPDGAWSRWGTTAGLAAAMLFAAEPVLAQKPGPPPGRPPAVRPPHGHDRSNIPPRANPDPPGRGNPHGPSQPRGPNRSVAADGAAPEAAAPAGVASPAAGRPTAARAGVLDVLAAPGADASPSRRGLLDLLGGAGASEAHPLAGALAPPENRQARAEAESLVADLRGLLLRPDGLQQAVGSYNALVDASSEAFLREPPPEFLDVQLVLALLVRDAFAAASPR